MILEDFLQDKTPISQLEINVLLLMSIFVSIPLSESDSIQGEAIMDKYNRLCEDYCNCLHNRRRSPPTKSGNLPKAIRNIFSDMSEKKSFDALMLELKKMPLDGVDGTVKLLTKLYDVIGDPALILKYDLAFAHDQKSLGALIDGWKADTGVERTTQFDLDKKKVKLSECFEPIAKYFPCVTNKARSFIIG